MFGDYPRKLFDAFHTLFGEFVHAVVHDVGFDVKSEVLFGLDFYPQSLRIEAVLILAGLAEHGVIADIHILHRSAPGVVDTHRVIGGYRSVQKAEALAVFVLFDELFEAGVLFPEPQHLFFDFDKISFSVFLSHAAYFITYKT